ncbi:DUF2798 domain-containing protein [Janthinobacterium sp. BJB1]|uniref:DUF2798 domain-containing protein n=1 Tax=Janthinobacterium sp. GW458P TaxID=1981504 RepID=UPI000A31FC96|nr:DUF2798 domain-containing protein [Janthinobacterium sp. GW458P]MBE3024886.1 DUF2798 domain-containing protein [Janthinobacterium sp. GW458P]PHV17821.1 DUF2798 domain-containing protein [Janthinobacterium sp. BJB303]PJC99693.1 DUF2798 domain-containing protein [Janthinobacterium sp. BJB1]
MSDALRLRFVFALLMSFVMTLLMSAWVTWLNIGLQADFLPRWRHAFFAAWPVAFCAVMLFAPRVQQLSRHIAARLARQAAS